LAVKTVVTNDPAAGGSFLIRIETSCGWNYAARGRAHPAPAVHRGAKWINADSGWFSSSSWACRFRSPSRRCPASNPQKTRTTAHVRDRTRVWSGARPCPER